MTARPPRPWPPTRAASAAVDLGRVQRPASMARAGSGPGQRWQLHRRRTGSPTSRSACAGRLHWDILALYQGVLDGLRAAAGRRRAGQRRRSTPGAWTTGCSTPAARCSATRCTTATRGPRASSSGCSRRIAGRGAVRGHRHPAAAVQHDLPARRRARARLSWRPPRTLLLIPDLLGLLADRRRSAPSSPTRPRRSCSTCGRRPGPPSLMAGPASPPALFPPLRQPGEHDRGPAAATIAAEAGLARRTLPVVAVGSHDTASAVVGVPAARAPTSPTSPAAPGRWSGIELDAPGADRGQPRGRTSPTRAASTAPIRYLRNVMGLWLLQESLRTWAARGLRGRPGDAAGRGGAGAAAAPVVDPDDPAFLAPGDMPARIAGACRRTGQRAAGRPAAIVRCIIDSLALAHRRAVADGPGTVRAAGRHRPHRRRRRPQRAAVPAHRGRLRAARGRRAGGGGRPRQHARAGARARAPHPDDLGGMRAAAAQRPSTCAASSRPRGHPEVGRGRPADRSGTRARLRNLTAPGT